MRFHKRIQNAEKLFSTTKKTEDVELEKICEWLVGNNEEFLDCVRQLFRLQCSNNMEESEGLKDKYKEQEATYMNRINYLIEQYRSKNTVCFK